MGTVVVGVDGSPGAAEALRVALAEARLRGARLLVVHAWTTPIFLGAPDPFLLELPARGSDLQDVVEQVESEARHVVDQAIEAATAGQPSGVEIEPAVVEGRPAQALIEASEGADLLVVGSRGHSGILGRLGSVSEHVSHHASCPVVIVPPPAARDNRG